MVSNNEIQDFVLLLRERGIQVGLSEHLDAQFCYKVMFEESASGEDSPLFLGLRSVLVKRLDDYPIFAGVYYDFFVLRKESARAVDSISDSRSKDKSSTEINRSEIYSSSVGKDSQQESIEDQKKVILSLYSNNKAKLRTIDFGDVEPFHPDDIRFMTRRLRKISRINRAVPGRRKSSYPGYDNSYINWRKLARLMSSHPDSMPEIQFMKKKLAKSKFVVMADVSGSMLKDTELVLNSLFTASRRFHGSEVFVFSTGLSRLTRFFSVASPNLDTVKQFYAKQTEIELGSGTRIGENLSRVIRDYPGVISNETTLIIISDGWDLGDSGLLESCLQDVRLKGAKIVWFHPHFGQPDFSPETLAMKTAMPYIDLMVGPSRPIQNFGSI